MVAVYINILQKATRGGCLTRNCYIACVIEDLNSYPPKKILGHVQGVPKERPT